MPFSSILNEPCCLSPSGAGPTQDRFGGVWAALGDAELGSALNSLKGCPAMAQVAVKISFVSGQAPRHRP